MKNNSGFALLTVVVLTWLLLGFSASYIGIMVQDKYSTLSSENQIKALAIAEGGMDGVLWIYNYDDEDFAGADFDPSAEGWELEDSDFDDATGSTIGTLNITIDNTTDPSSPLITSTGTIDAAGTDSSKSVTVSAALVGRPIYKAAIMTKGTIDISADIDSYTSPTAYGGLNIAENADVLTNSTAANAISVGNGDTISGNAGTGSGGTIDNDGDITGTQSDNVNNAISDVEIPDALIALGDSAVNFSMNGGSAPVSWSGNKRYNSFAMSGSTITITGPTQLYLDSSAGWVFSTSGTGTINVDTLTYPTASLAIYTNGNFKMQGTGIINTSGSTNPQAVQIFGTSNCTTATIGGNNAFSGLVNAPYATVNVTGSSEFYGAIIANVADINQPIHYDENLLTNGPTDGYDINWVRRS